MVGGGGGGGRGRGWRDRVVKNTQLVILALNIMIALPAFIL